MSTLSVIQDLNPSRCICQWLSFTTRWYFMPLWNLNVCKDQSHPSGGRGGAISRNPQTLHTAVPLQLERPEVFLQFATRGQECLGVLFFPPLLLFTLIPSVCLLKVTLDTHKCTQTHSGLHRSARQYSFPLVKCRCLHMAVRPKRRPGPASRPGCF